MRNYPPEPIKFRKEDEGLHFMCKLMPDQSQKIVIAKSLGTIDMMNVLFGTVEAIYNRINQSRCLCSVCQEALQDLILIRSMGKKNGKAN